MDKTKLLKEVRKEIESEKKEVVKIKLKEMLVEIEMAKATVKKLEKQFENYLKNKDEDVIFELEYPMNQKNLVLEENHHMILWMLQ